MKNIGENVVRIEAEALGALADRIGGPMAAAFQRAVDLMFSCAGRVVVTGMGKSGLIARKIAATLSSTGTPALYLHPVEALHGDLGMVVRGDVVLALSASGETEEILALLGDDQAVAGAADCDDWGCDLGGGCAWREIKVKVKSSGRGRPLHASKFHPCVYFGFRGGSGFGLLDCGGGLLAGAGAYCVDHYDAGFGGCAGGYAQREARV